MPTHKVDEGTWSQCLAGCPDPGFGCLSLSRASERVTSPAIS